METVPHAEEIASRRAGYVAEFQEFFQNSHIPYGSPMHLATLNERIANNANFRDDMISMCRSVVSRQGGELPATELLLIVVNTVCGDRTQDQPSDYAHQVKQLLDFLARVLRVPVEPRPSGTVLPMRAPRSGSATVPPQTYEGETAEKRDPPDNLHRAATPATSPVPTTKVKTVAKGKHADSLHHWWPTAAAVTLLIAAVSIAGITHSHATANLAHLAISRGAGSATEASTGAGAPAVSSAKPSPLVASIAPGSRPVAHSAQPAASGLAHPSTPSTEVPRDATVTVTPHGSQIAATDPADHGSAESPASSTSQHSSALSQRPSPANITHSTSRSVLDVSSGVMGANLLSAPAPEYPRLAGLMHLEGTVILQAVIAQDGSVSATHVLRGNRLLRGAAVNAVRQWRYRPYYADGHPIDVSTVITVNFRRQQ
jgi:TonB family protein